MEIVKKEKSRGVRLFQATVAIGTILGAIFAILVVAGLMASVPVIVVLLVVGWVF